MKKVLIADDAVFMRTILKSIFEKGGYIVIGEAGDGNQAVEMYKSLRPDIVTLDITMPNIDGLSALKLIKEVDPYANIIMCSAMGQQAMVLEAIQNGARDFIVKPFQPVRVLEAVKKALG